MIGILGGSFDPIHYGHTRAALEALQRLSLRQVLFVPCGAHALGKTFAATPTQRLTMLQHAIAAESRFAIDTRELDRPNTSYTIDTVHAIAHEHAGEKLAFLLGMDQFLALPQWHRWQELLEVTSLVVLARSHYTVDETSPLHAYWQQHRCTDLTTFAHAEKNSIAWLNIPLLDISSHYIRTQIAAGFSARDLVHNSVLTYLQQEKLYGAE